MNFKVSGMNCAACSARVERAASAVDGVENCQVNLLTGTMSVVGGDAKEIIEAVKNAGYLAELSVGAALDAPRENAEEDKKIFFRLVTSMLILLPLMYISMGHMLGLPSGFLEGRHFISALIQSLLSLAVLVLNKSFFLNGVRGAFHGAPNMDTLVSLGSSASFVYSTALTFLIYLAEAAGDMEAAMTYSHGLYFESAAMILVLITLGKLLESRAKKKTSGAIKSLLGLAPGRVRVIRNGEEILIDVSQLNVGDIFAVRQGEAFAADGVITEGECAVDESMLTGESIPVDKSVGDSVFSGTVNKSGYIKCQANSVSDGTLLSNIIKTVSEASATKAPIAKAADRVAAIFVPLVICISVITTVAWCIAGAEFGYALARGVSVLVISCPCALGLATPVAIMVGTGLAARRGVLFRSAEAIERLGGVSTVVLDKTGTITRAEPEVMRVVAIGVTEEVLLSYAHGVEYGSEHPLAKAVVNYCVQNNIKKPEFEHFESVVGSGVCAIVNGKKIEAGSYAYYKRQGSSELAERLYSEMSELGQTPIYFTLEGELIGVIGIADEIRSDSKDAVSKIKALGARAVMLTGDNEKTAAAIASRVGIDEVVAGVLPNGKAETVQKYRGGGVAMVGDGVNDAPALATADVGIAIASGSDVAIESADVVLIKHSVLGVCDAIKISRRTIINIKENLFWAFFYNVAAIPVAAGVFVPLGVTLTPMIAALAMSFSSLFVVLNALRLNWFYKDR